MTSYCNPNTEIFQYADDTPIFAQIKTLLLGVKPLKHKLNVYALFFEKIRLQLSALKRKILLFNKFELEPRKLEVVEETIHNSKSMKYLGTCIDSDM